MRICDYENCHFHSSEALQKSGARMKWVICPGCMRRSYHSEICQMNDYKHRSICKPRKKEPSIPVIKNPPKSLSKIFRSIKEFKIEMNKNLGIGGFGTVYQIEHMMTKQKYAVKISYKSDLFEKNLCSLIQNEITIHHKLRHPHIIN
jgi:hypothetical protein